uniref:Calmodulin-binding domain-containing protein n=1 Tax=Oryza rufipogon TaxID=4529 RepID=A0A0E0P1G4_ORYRU
MATNTRLSRSTSRGCPGGSSRLRRRTGTRATPRPKKGDASAPVSTDSAAAAANKFVAVVKEAIKKQRDDDDAAAENSPAASDELVRRFKGSRVKTAMEKRSEEEQPRRREMARWSNDVIEEARSKLLEKRQCSRVKALVGAVETVMDAKSAGDGAAASPASRSTTTPAAYPNEEKREREEEKGRAGEEGRR